MKTYVRIPRRPMSGFLSFGEVGLFTNALTPQQMQTAYEWYLATVSYSCANWEYNGYLRRRHGLTDRPYRMDWLVGCENYARYFPSRYNLCGPDFMFV